MLIGTPEHKEARDRLSQFMVANLTKNSDSIEFWVEALDLLKNYAVRYVFPNITLKPLVDSEWFKVLLPKITGDEGLYREQGYHEFMEWGTGNTIWGIQRRGSWFQGNGIQSEARGTFVGIQLRECSTRELLDNENMRLGKSHRGHTHVSAAEMVFERLNNFIGGQIIERQRRVDSLREAFNPLDLFGYGLKLKIESRKFQGKLN